MKCRKAFTLIELMIVVVILTILATAAEPMYRSSASRAYESEILASLSMVRTVQRVFKSVNGEYPSSMADLDGTNYPDEYLTAEDFVDMRYVDYDDFAVDGTGSTQWNGYIQGYKYTTVTMSADGFLTREP